jgi:hypothetical protein
MAGTLAGARLTTEHRAAQLAIRAGSIANLVTLWRVVDPADLRGTIEVFAQAAALLAAQGFDRSAGVSSRYYALFRRAEGLAGAAPATVAARPPMADLAGELRGASLAGIVRARRAGMTVEGAKVQGFARATGSLAKLVLSGGRRTLVAAVEADPQARGWARVTSGSPCAFCRMLASRGATYKTERSADFESHDACGCTVEPLFAGGRPPAQSAQYAREWQAAQAWARDSGTMSDGTSSDQLNNYRRYLAARVAT